MSSNRGNEFLKVAKENEKGKNVRKSIDNFEN